MQIISVSRGSQSQGTQFAEKLAAKLGYECVSREQLVEEATRARIPIGKLETAIIKPHIFSEQLARELEHYKALVTSILCEKALGNDIVYHGRTGHLLLSGVRHILKIRVVSDMDYRIRHVMTNLGLSRAKSKRYIEQIDDDRRRWVKRFYNVEWDIFTLYDVVLNLTEVNVDNVASGMCAMAQLPEFKATPASMSDLLDMYVTSRARIMLARDSRTSHANVKIRTHSRVVHITYLSQEIEDAEILLEVLRNLEDAKEVVCTKAATNILWVQEAFDAPGASYQEVLSLANAWDAAVELVKMTPGEEPECEPPSSNAVTPISDTWRETGLIDDDETIPPDPKDLATVYEKLIRDGRAGGKRTLRGCQKALLTAIDPAMRYRLIIFDNMFLSKGEANRKRLCREWANLLSDSLKSPVVTIDEIAVHYHFGLRQALSMALCAALTALLVFVVLRFDQTILTFLSREGFMHRVESGLIILVVVPLFAFLYSTVTRLLLSLFRLD